MAHRFNSVTGRKEPKPSASERTWSRWRVRKRIETQEDVQRLSRLEEVKERIKEAFFNKLRAKKEKEKKPI